MEGKAIQKGYTLETSEVSTGSSQILWSGWKCNVRAFWGQQIYYYSDFHILLKVQKKWGHKRQGAQNCNSFYIKMILFLKQEWKMMYLFTERCLRIPSRTRQVAHNRGSHITFYRTYWWCSRAFHGVMAHSSTNAA